MTWFLLCATLLSSLEDLPRKDVLALQAALEAKGFSPGLIDGIAGPRTSLALSAFQLAAGLERTGQIDHATRRALDLEGAPGVAEHVIAESEVKQVDYCPPDWNERSRRQALLYPTLSNCLAEKFHTSERCLAYLNPGIELSSLRAGDRIVVPALRERALPAGPVELEIDLEARLILLLGARGIVEGLVHCSVARDLALVERGDCAVSTIVEAPGYTFDPAKWPEVKDVTRKLSIPPGPRSPVGIRWIGLDRPGVGIHGTPEPENIGKTGSHGCFRLTNWDAAHLASVISRGRGAGTRVRIVDRSPAAARILGEEPLARRP